MDAEEAKRVLDSLGSTNLRFHWHRQLRLIRLNLINKLSGEPYQLLIGLELLHSYLYDPKTFNPWKEDYF